MKIRRNQSENKKIKCEHCDDGILDASLSIPCPECDGTGFVESKKPREAYDPLIHGISQTALDIWLQCREKARIKYRVGIKPPEKKSFAEGSSMHAILEIVYKMILAKKISNPAEVPSVVIRLVEFIERKMVDKGEHQRLEKIQPVLDSAAVVIPSYFVHYKKDFTEEWIDIEKDFKYDLPVGYFKGTYDGRFKKKDKIWVFETKFKSMWGENYSDLLQLDLQIAAYTMASEAEGIVGGTRYNIVRKPQLKRKKDENRKSFINRLSDDILSRTDFYFERHDVPLTKAELSLNRKRIIALCAAFVEWYSTTSSVTEERDMLFNSSACESKYGACEFLRNCSTGIYE